MKRLGTFTTLTALCAAMLFAACNEGPIDPVTETPTPDAPLEGPMWILQSIKTVGDTELVITRTDYRVTFRAHNSLWLQAACNTGGGTYSLQDSSITGDFWTTKVGCQNDLYSQSFLSAIQNEAGFYLRIKGDTLLITGDGKTLRFVGIASQKSWNQNFPTMALRCTSASIPCAFDYNMSRDSLSNSSKARISQFQSDSTYLSVAIATLTDRAFKDSSLIFNFPQDTVLIHFDEIGPSPIEDVFWSGNAMGMHSGESGFFVMPNSVEGWVSLYGRFFLVLRLEKNIYLVLERDPNRNIRSE